MYVYVVENFKVIECCSCHIPFAITPEHNNELLNTKKTFYCPNGHAQSYIGYSLKERLEQKEKELAICKDDKKSLYERISKQNDTIEYNKKVQNVLKANIKRLSKKHK